MSRIIRVSFQKYSLGFDNGIVSYFFQVVSLSAIDASTAHHPLRQLLNPATANNRQMAESVDYVDHPLLTPSFIERRLYQIQLAGTARNGHTLVCLPTGLGKTTVSLLVTAERLHEMAANRCSSRRRNRWSNSRPSSTATPSPSPTTRSSSSPARSAPTTAPRCGTTPRSSSPPRRSSKTIWSATGFPSRT